MSLKITLIHHPTVALKIIGFNENFSSFSESGAYLGNIYKKIIPQSLTRVASIMEKELHADVDILDLRILDPDREERYKTVDWEGYTIEASRIGAEFAMADNAIRNSDWIGLSCHFTFESGVIEDFIHYAKKINPDILIVVGGADVKVRAEHYIHIGADLAFRGDFDSSIMQQNSIIFPRIVSEYRHPFPELSTPALDKLPYIQSYQDSHDGKVPDAVSTPVGFLYLTRGCPRECDFCESRLTKFEQMAFDDCIQLLKHYKKYGITTINFADDNLLLRATKKAWRQEFFTLLQTMREMGFAWEFPNGLELGRLLKPDGDIDTEMMSALFTHSIDPFTGRLIGAYRLYAPIESFDNRDLYRKLKPAEDQLKILTHIAQMELLAINFGVVVPPDATEETFQSIEDGYNVLKNVFANSTTLARYGVFHLIPISLYRGMETKYSVEDFPEGWNFYFPVYDGTNFSARELFDRRLELMQRIDIVNFKSMSQGEYKYG